MLDFIIFYFLVGLVINVGITGWLWYVVNKSGYTLRTNWFNWCLIIFIWPIVLYQFIKGWNSKDAE